MSLKSAVAALLSSKTELPRREADPHHPPQPGSVRLTTTNARSCSSCCSAAVGGRGVGVGYDEAAVDLRWTEDFAVPMGVGLDDDGDTTTRMAARLGMTCLPACLTMDGKQVVSKVLPGKSTDSTS